MMRSLAFLSLTLAVACAGPSTSDSSTSSSSSTGGVSSSEMPDAGPAPVCTEATAVACEDQLIQQLDLQDSVAPGQVNTTELDGVKFTDVDATAGGFGASPPHAYVYGRFTDTGFDKVDITDEESLASMEWDLAFRRYVIRINSGTGGPSCVRVARIPPAIRFDDVTQAPTDLPWRQDESMTESCDFVSDGSGLATSPLTALSGYYEYGTCVQMTGTAYVVQLRNARHVKIEMTEYYNQTAQAACNATGTAPMPSGSGNMRFKWKYLD